jgi:hypothetical protein
MAGNVADGGRSARISREPVGGATGSAIAWHVCGRVESAVTISPLRICSRCKIAVIVFAGGSSGDVWCPLRTLSTCETCSRRSRPATGLNVSPAPEKLSNCCRPSRALKARSCAVRSSRPRAKLPLRLHRPARRRAVPSRERFRNTSRTGVRLPDFRQAERLLAVLACL